MRRTVLFVSEVSLFCEIQHMLVDVTVTKGVAKGEIPGYTRPSNRCVSEDQTDRILQELISIGSFEFRRVDN